jgi:hypothetical protein
MASASLSQMKPLGRRDMPLAREGSIFRHTKSTQSEMLWVACDSPRIVPMVSVNHFRQELQWQMDRAAGHGALDILINAGELCRSLRGGAGRADACCKAMRAELNPRDTVLIEADAGVGMTVRYRLPRG